MVTQEKLKRRPLGYILGIGSNVNPRANVPRLLEQLVRHFGPILISRFYETAPVGMDGERRFINFCAFARTRLEPLACKAICVGIEVALGRDRTHPSRKTRDRPADIDLLVRVGADGQRVQLEAIADYLAQPAAEIVTLLSAGQPMPAARGRCRTLMVGELLLGEAPAAIDRDDRAGLVVVGQDRLHGQPDRLSASFLAQQRLPEHPFARLRTVPVLEEDWSGLDDVDLHLRRQPFGERQA